MKRTFFQSKLFPFFFLAPQLLISLIFFFWPAGQAVHDSFYQSDAWGGGSIFVGLANYWLLFADPYYRTSIITTLILMGFVFILTLIQFRFIERRVHY